MTGKNYDRSILQRIFDTKGRKFPPEVAGFILELSLTNADHERIAFLSDKANEGVLTPAEHDELATYVLLGDFLTIMQSRAKAAMNQSPAA
jgi:hypothetical protein